MEQRDVGRDGDFDSAGSGLMHDSIGIPLESLFICLFIFEVGVKE